MAEVMPHADPMAGLSLVGGDRVELAAQILTVRAEALAELEAAGFQVGQRRPEIVTITVQPGSYVASKFVHGEEYWVNGNSLEGLARDVAQRENKSKKESLNG
jgi:hypothetical protein